MKKTGRRILYAGLILLAAAGFCAVTGIFTYLFVPPEFTRAKIYSIENNRYDIIAFGTSHGVCAIDPDVISAESGKTCYNAAAGGLYPESTYYLVRDAAERGSVSEILYEFDPTYWLTESGGNPNEWYALHYMAFSPAKLRFLANAAAKRDFRLLAMPWYMFERTVENAEENIQRKQTEDYREHRMALFSSATNEARENGFYAVGGTYGTGSEVPLYDAFSGSSVEKNREYFEKTLSYLNGRGIPVTVVLAPVPAETAEANAAFYETASEMMRDIAKRYNVTYYDFVTARGESVTMPGRAFYDMEGHMHAHGAEAFSRALGTKMKE